MSATTQSKQINKLRTQLAEKDREILALSEQLFEAKKKRDFILPSGMYLEQDPSGQLILHVPAETTYFPVNLGLDDATAMRHIRRIFSNQKVLPHKIGTDAVPTDRVLKEWLQNGGRVGTDRKLKIEEFNP
jgi:hypothetical protein